MVAIARGKIETYLFLLLLVFTASACSAAQLSGPTPAPDKPAVAAKQRVDVASDSNSWDNLVIQAQKESTLVIYSGPIAEARQALMDAFKQKYGISLDIIVGRGEEVVNRIDLERRAGIYGVDLGFHGMTTFFNSIKPKGFTVPIEPLIVLPEVKDVSKWRSGKLPFADKEGHLATLVLGPYPSMAVNTDAVKPGMIATHSDLLGAAWRGKVVIQDPSMGGAGTEWFTFVVKEMMGIEKGAAFMKQLARQEPAVTRDVRLLIEWVARGKYAVALAPDRVVVIEFMRAGSPVAFPELKEPRATSSGPGNVMVFDRAPHPNAARLFINWLLSKEGIAVYAKASGLASTRVDVPAEGIDPFLVPKADEAILGEEYQLAKGEMRNMAAEIFGNLIK